MKLPFEIDHRAIIFRLVLKPLIAANYWLRFHRFAQDRWYWADALACSWGFIYLPKWLEDRP